MSQRQPGFQVARPPEFMVKTLPLPVLMMTGFALALALALNHPAPRAQAGRIAAHAPAALSVAALMGQPLHLAAGGPRPGGDGRPPEVHRPAGGGGVPGDGPGGHGDGGVLRGIR